MCAWTPPYRLRTAGPTTCRSPVNGSGCCRALQVRPNHKPVPSQVLLTVISTVSSSLQSDEDSGPLRVPDTRSG